jgi:hypothetical protein
MSCLRLAYNLLPTGVFALWKNHRLYSPKAHRVQRVRGSGRALFRIGNKLDRLPMLGAKKI